MSKLSRWARGDLRRRLDALRAKHGAPRSHSPALVPARPVPDPDLGPASLHEWYWNWAAPAHRWKWPGWEDGGDHWIGGVSESDRAAAFPRDTCEGAEAGRQALAQLEWAFDHGLPCGPAISLLRSALAGYPAPAPPRPVNPRPLARAPVPPTDQCCAAELESDGRGTFEL